MKHILKKIISITKNKIINVAGLRTSITENLKINAIKSLQPNDKNKALYLLKKLKLNYECVFDNFYVLYVKNSKYSKCLFALNNATQGFWTIVDKNLYTENTITTVFKNINVDILLKEAVELQVSDIFINAVNNNLSVQFRKNRLLYESKYKYTYDKGINLMRSLLILGNLDFYTSIGDIKEGHFMYKLNDMTIFCRISYISDFLYKTLSLRLLNENLLPFQLEKLGLPNDLSNFISETAINWRNGMILISGSTGTGKTTTLYSLAKLFCKQNCKIISLEDPIESNIGIWIQSEIHSNIGYTFDIGIKSILRQNPDIVIIGEIRDTESAKAAFYASLAGYLVITTIHANTLDMVYLRCKSFGLQFSEFTDNVRLQIHQNWDLNSNNNSPVFTWQKFNN